MPGAMGCPLAACCFLRRRTVTSRNSSLRTPFPRGMRFERSMSYLRQSPEDLLELTQEEVKDALGLSLGNEGIGTCERLLEKAGVLERMEPNQKYGRRPFRK